MSDWLRYRSRREIEAKVIDHDGAGYDPRTGQKQNFRKGDLRVKGSAEVMDGETFHKDWEQVTE